MFDTLPIHSEKPVALVGGGWVHEEILQQYVKDSYIIALDGGADILARLGLQPDCIIGDMDSMQNSYTCPIHHFSDQNSTDFDKALRNISAPLLVAFGVLGDRFDHGLATLQSLTRHEMAMKTTLIGREDAICYVQAERKELNLPVASRISLWCMENTEFLASRGLRYPLDGLTLGPSETQGTSNITSKADIVIEKKPQQSGYFLIIPVFENQ